MATDIPCMDEKHTHSHTFSTTASQEHHQTTADEKRTPTTDSSKVGSDVPVQHFLRAPRVVLHDTTPHHIWMQEYHNKHHWRWNQGTHAQPQIVVKGHNYGGFSDLNDANQLTNDGGSAMTNRKASNGDNKSSKENRSQQQTGSFSRRFKNGILDGCNVYRGHSFVNPRMLLPHYDSRMTLELVSVDDSVLESRHHTNPPLLSFNEKQVTVKQVTVKQVTSDGAQTRTTTTGIHPQMSVASTKHQVQRRMRPQSASLSYSSSRSQETIKVTRSKPLFCKSGTSANDFNRTVNINPASHSLNKSDSVEKNAICLSPRTLGTIPRPSYKLDANFTVKSESLTRSPPKSILKNNKQPTDQNGCFPAHPLKISPQVYKRTTSRASSQMEARDFILDDVFTSPREAVRALPTGNEQTIPTTSQGTSASSDAIVALRPKRPMSALVRSSKCELNGQSLPRRKSVTFNSFVSLSTGNQVSTIRFLSVDV